MSDLDFLFPTTGETANAAPGGQGDPTDFIFDTIGKQNKTSKELATRARAEQEVAKRRREGTAGQLASDVAWDVVRGTPVGPYMDEALAFGSSVLSGTPYDEELAYQRASNRAIDRASPVIATLPGIGDVTVGGVAKTAGGVASGLGIAGAAGRAGGMVGRFVGPGATPARTVGKIAAGGAVGGASYGFGEGEGEDRGQNALLGAGLGAVAGPAAYGAGALATRGYQAARQALRPTPAPLQGRSGAAVETMRRAVDMDDAAVGRFDMDRARRRLPDGMVLDSGDAVQGLAQGAIASNTPAKTTVRQAIRDRSAQGVRRLEAAATRAMGQGEDIAEMLAREKAAAASNANPLYKEFRDTVIQPSVQTQRLVARLEQLYPDLVDATRESIAASTRLTAAQKSNPAVFLDTLRQELQAIAKPGADMAGQTALTRNARTNAGDYAKLVNKTLDREMRRAGKPGLYANARGTIEQLKDFEDGIAAGRNLLTKSSATPSTIRQMIARGKGRYAEGIRTAAREDIRQAMQGARSVYGSDAAEQAGMGRMLRNLSSAEARAKLRAMGFKQSEVSDLVRTMDQEGAFLGTKASVLGGSQTAERQEARKLFPQVRDNEQALRAIGQRTSTGLPMEAAARAFNKVFQGEINAQTLRQAKDIGEMLIAQGADRDALVRELRAMTDRMALNDAQKAAVGRMLATLGTAVSQRALGMPAGEPLRVEVTGGDVRRNNPNALMR